jgi:hypothetical protein
MNNNAEKAGTNAPQSTEAEVPTSAPIPPNPMLYAALPSPIAEGNRLIMEFDGWILKPYQTFDSKNNTQKPGSNTYYSYEKEGRICRIEDIEFDIVYHTSWEALMPILLRIISDNRSQFVLECPAYNGYTEWLFSMLDDTVISQSGKSESPIEAVWQAIVKYIKWCNENWGLPK